METGFLSSWKACSTTRRFVFIASTAQVVPSFLVVCKFTLKFHPVVILKHFEHLFRHIVALALLQHSRRSGQFIIDTAYTIVSCTFRSSSSSGVVPLPPAYWYSQLNRSHDNAGDCSSSWWAICNYTLHVSCDWLTLGIWLFGMSPLRSV